MFTYQIDEEISLVLPQPKLDAAPLFHLIQTSRSELEPWLPWVQNLKHIQDEQTFLMIANQHYVDGKSLNTIIRYQGIPVGMISFNRFNNLNQSAEIGYWLATPFVGHNIMHRAVLGICELGFQNYKLNKIEIHAAIDNQRSNAVAQHAGFHFDGCCRDAVKLLDGYHDGHIWSILKNEWLQQH
jgi:ribosomal-protein-serine acetyltransferase